MAKIIPITAQPWPHTRHEKNLGKRKTFSRLVIQWPSGIDELRSAVDLKASDPDYLMSLGDGYYNTHRFAEAAAEYREVIRVASDSKVTQAWHRQSCTRQNNGQNCAPRG